MQMDGWLGLVGAAVGAGIAIVGQYVTTRRERKGRLAELLLEQCAQAVALEEDFRSRLFEERRLGRIGRVEEWDLRASTLAGARLRLLSNNEELLASARELAEAGTDLGRYWRTGGREPEEVDRLWRRHRQGIDSFIGVAGVVVRDRIRT